MKEIINLIFTIDDNYIQHFTVALISVIENNKGSELNVFVIHDITDLKLLNEVKCFFDEKYNIYISLLSLENSLFDHYILTHHVSKATYFRLMIADIIPDNIDKAIFLDSDLIVTGSLKELMDLDFKECYLFAARDLAIEAGSIARLNEMGVPAEKYFNAGVMLLNLKAWRTNNLSRHLISTAKKYMDKLLWWDQDVLNIYLFDKWQQLNPKYNEKDIIKPLKVMPVIVHYAGSSKPWHYLNRHPYKKLYWEYLRLSPFRNYKYTDITIKNVIKKTFFRTMFSF